LGVRLPEGGLAKHNMQPQAKGGGGKCMEVAATAAAATAFSLTDF